MEKPVIFTYEEIFSTTDGFSDSSLLGHGTYGSVYYGLLRDQVCSFLPGSYKFFLHIFLCMKLIFRTSFYGYRYLVLCDLTFL